MSVSIEKTTAKTGQLCSIVCNSELWNLTLGSVFTEVEPISTYVDFGEREFLVADERGYEHLLYKMAETFLLTSEGEIMDSRLKLNKVISCGFSIGTCFVFFLHGVIVCFVLLHNPIIRWKQGRVDQL